MTQTDATSQLLTWEEVCSRLKIARTTLYQLRKQGHLPGIELPPAAGDGTKPMIRWRESEVEAFIQSRTAAAP